MALSAGQREGAAPVAPGSLECSTSKAIAVTTATSHAAQAIIMRNPAHRRERSGVCPAAGWAADAFAAEAVDETGFISCLSARLGGREHLVAQKGSNTFADCSADEKVVPFVTKWDNLFQSADNREQR